MPRPQFVYIYESHLDLFWNHPVQGVVVVQVPNHRKLKMEVCPQEKAVEVSGFSGAARIYER